MDEGAATLVVDFAKAFDKVPLKVVWAWTMHFGFPKQFFGCSAGTSSTSEGYFSKGVVADPLQSITAILPGPKWSVSFSRTVMQDAMGEVLKVNLQVKFKVYVGDIKI